MIRTWLVGGFALALAACGGYPPMAGFQDADWKIRSFYERYAWEQGATCLAPRMRITGYRVVEQTPERTILDVRYAYNDNRFGDSDRLATGRCNGFSQRQFTLSGRPDGSVNVVAMTGEQRAQR